MAEITLESVKQIPRLTAIITKIVEDTLKNSNISGDVNFADLSLNRTLLFYCIEPVTITVNGEDTNYEANTQVSVFLEESDTWSITTTSDLSILILNNFPGVLSEFYSWLEGVVLFTNIIFDMNDSSMYSKWCHNNEGKYHVQEAQYTNCIFWSDLPLTINKNDYYLHKSFLLPLCYSQIPENTYKAFGCCYAAVCNPNWANDNYKSSFALSTGTGAWAYTGQPVIGSWDEMDHNIITLPEDCKGMMLDSETVTCVGILDAANTTSFGAKMASWRECFGNCYLLKLLYIKNLKCSLNVSWSDIEPRCIEYIIDNAANTDAITIYVSPYTYYRLSEDIKTEASDKNITLELITTNKPDDNRGSTYITKSKLANILATVNSEFIDLGLPSGLLWATYNVGATKPEEYGDYFAYGELEGFTADDVANGIKAFSWSDYKFGTSDNLSKYNTTDGLTTLELEDDAIYKFNKAYRIPTIDEYQELIDNTTSTWETLNGINGRRFTGTNGNSIFIPASGANFNGASKWIGTGCYTLSSSLNSEELTDAYYMSFGSSKVITDYGYRFYGLSIRPVMESKFYTKAEIDALLAELKGE